MAKKLKIPGESNGRDPAGSNDPGGTGRMSNAKDPASGSARASGLSTKESYPMWSSKSAAESAFKDDGRTESTGGDATAGKGAAEGYSGKKESHLGAPVELAENHKTPEGYQINSPSDEAANGVVHREEHGLEPTRRMMQPSEADRLSGPAITKPGIPSPAALEERNED